MDAPPPRPLDNAARVRAWRERRKAQDSGYHAKEAARLREWRARQVRERAEGREFAAWLSRNGWKEAWERDED